MSQTRERTRQSSSQYGSGINAPHTHAHTHARVNFAHINTSYQTGSVASDSLLKIALLSCSVSNDVVLEDKNPLAHASPIGEMICGDRTFGNGRLAIFLGNEAVQAVRY